MTQDSDTAPSEGFATLRLERVGAIGVVTLCRPELLNRFDDALHVEFTGAIRELAGDPAVRAIVVASTGRVFSAGGDLALLESCNGDPQTTRRVVEDGRRLLAAVTDVPQPVVVALQGDAIGVGATVALSFDAIVAARTARIMDPHVCMGLVAGDGGCLVWPEAVGSLRARRYLLTGDPIDAEAAYTFGLVTDLVDEPDQVLSAAIALAQRMASLPPLAVQGTKRTLNVLAQARAAEVMDIGFTQAGITLRSQDLLEAIAAFRERRAPTYVGQ